jgi:hypothetical protein
MPRLQLGFEHFMTLPSAAAHNASPLLDRIVDLVEEGYDVEKQETMLYSARPQRAAIAYSLWIGQRHPRDSSASVSIGRGEGSSCSFHWKSLCTRRAVAA